MKYRKYSQTPLQVRLHEFQEKTINELITDKEYCQNNRIYSKSDLIRNELNSALKTYEQYKFNKSISA
jgi:cysteinyl-tRNA synthetase